jgi:hypothetical protein
VRCNSWVPSRLQLLDRAGGGGARQAEILRGGGETAAIDDAHEKAHGIQGIELAHCAAHSNSDD